MKNLFFKKMVIVLGLVALMVASFSVMVLANSSGLTSTAAEADIPWAKPVGMIESALTGNVAKGIAIIAIAVAGLGMSFGEGQQRKIFKVVLGVAIAFGAGTIATKWFTTPSGLAFSIINNILNIF